MGKGERGESENRFDLSDVIGGTLNIFGLNIDLGRLLSSPEDLRGGLEELRERLKEAGGREVLSDEEWKKSGATISGYVRTRGLLGDREYHIGTSVPPRERRRRQPSKQETIEPVVDIFREDKEVIVVAEVPGVELADLQLGVQDDVLSLSTKATAGRGYRKDIDLGCSVDEGTLKATCRNGILEIRLQKRTSGETT